MFSLKSIFPREGRFYDLLDQAAELGTQGAKEFQALLLALPDAEAHVQKIKGIEHQADEVTHQTIALLHKTFVTPIDSEDIHALITRMDDILDFIDAAAQRVQLFDMQKATPDMVALAAIIVTSTARVQEAVRELEKLRNPNKILENCVEINRLENDADSVLRAAMAKLFREEPDDRELIKKKEIYELLETVTDRCEDVANVLEGIVLENA